MSKCGCTIDRECDQCKSKKRRSDPYDSLADGITTINDIVVSKKKKLKTQESE